MIEVILLERIERLGQMGQVVKVRPGFARNFLLPQSKALRATKANLEQFEKQRAQLESKNAAERSKAEGLAGKLEGLKVIVIRQASEAGHLYGSVSARDVAEAGAEAGETIDKSQVQIDTPIKTLGLFPVKVKLHPEVTIKLTVNVARSPEEAKVQAEKGAAVIKGLADAETAAAPAEEQQPVAEEQEVEVPKAKGKKAKATEESGEAEEAPKAKKAKAKKAAAED